MDKTVKLFDEWNKEKKNIEHSNIKTKRVSIWEIWICKIWINIGSEISKDDSFQRPVLIIWNYLWGDLVSIIPLSTKYNKNYKSFYIKIENHTKFWLNKPSYLCINQIRTISIKRLIKKINNTKIKWKYKKVLPINFIKEVIKSTFELYIPQQQAGGGTFKMSTTNNYTQN